MANLLRRRFNECFIQVGSVAADTSFLLLWALIQALAEYVISNFVDRLGTIDQVILRLIQIAFGISTVLPILDNVRSEFQIIRERNRQKLLRAKVLLKTGCQATGCPVFAEAQLTPGVDADE